MGRSQKRVGQKTNEERENEMAKQMTKEKDKFSSLRRLLEMRAQLKRQADELEEEMRGLSTAIREELEGMGKGPGESVDIPCGDGKAWRTMLQTRTTEKIVPERLLEKGVALAVIKYATDVRVSEPFATVREVKYEGE